MKKTLSLISALALVLTLGTPAFAASYDSSVSGNIDNSAVPVLIASCSVNEYDALVTAKQSSVGLTRSTSSVENLLMERAELPSEILAQRYDYNDEEIALLKSYDGSPIENNRQLRGIFANLNGFIYRMDYDTHGVTVRFSWNWDGPPLLWENDVVTCAWVGVNSSNGPHALRFTAAESACHVDYYDTDAFGKEDFMYRLEYDIDDANVNSNVSANFEMGDDSNPEIWGKKGYMDIVLAEPVATSNLQYSTVVFGYGHQTLVFDASFSVNVDGISVSITPKAGTEEMYNGSISIWSDGRVEWNGDAA